MMKGLSLMKTLRCFFVILVVVSCLNAYGWQVRQPDVIFVPTPSRVVEEMLRVADIRQDDLIYDLGCGDGRIVISAAQKVGSRGIGVDIDPQRIEESNQNAAKAGVTQLVQFLEQDLFQTDFSEATVVTLYLLPMLNLQLRPKLLTELRPGTRVVSHDFGMNEWLPDQKTVVVIEERHHWVFYWIVPANVIGQWELTVPELFDEGPVTMFLEQVYQYVVGAIILGGSRRHLKNSKLSGNFLRFELEFERERKVLPILFEGEVHGDLIKGTATWNRSSRVIKHPWEAFRDPRTVEPIDVVSFMRSLYDKTKR
jgi:SAM-dependent methyltransferase